MSLRSWRARRRKSLVCRDAVALMTDYLDGRLASNEHARLEAHLATCPHCAEYLAQLRVTVRALNAQDLPPLSDDALDAFVEIYEEWRRNSV